MIKLLDFQIEALTAVKDYERCAFYHEMGLGKTFTGGEKLMSFNNQVNLVVCQKSKIADWVNHFEQHYDIEVFNLAKVKQLNAFMQSTNRKLGVVNYDLLTRRPALYTLRDIAIVFDESSMLKNDRAKRTKCAMSLSVKQLVLLSGTPVGGKYEELWTQCRLLGWNIPKAVFWDYFVRYTEWQPVPFARPINLVYGYKNVNELKLMLHYHGAHFLRSNEVLSLPQQVFNTIRVDCPSEYFTFMHDNVVTVDGDELVADMPLKKLLYARELCGVYCDEKLKAFEDFINSTSERVIVFYNFTRELDALLKIVGKSRGVSIINGTTKNLDAYDTDSTSVTFVQYQAGALGLNLQKAHYIAYYSLPLSSELFEQSKKRIHRIGQAQPCFYYTFICNESVEEKIATTLAERCDYTLELFNEYY